MIEKQLSRILRNASHSYLGTQDLSLRQGESDSRSVKLAKIVREFGVYPLYHMDISMKDRLNFYDDIDKFVQDDINISQELIKIYYKKRHNEIWRRTNINNWMGKKI